MKLIIGLGNPGKKYTLSRHNIGFMAIDNYADLNNLKFKEKYNGLYSEFNKYDEKIILLKPQNFMNLSGGVVHKYKEYYDIPLKDILVIYDDVSFDVGSYKLKKLGSSGGHNGIEDIINVLKTNEIQRLKIGISKNKKELKKYVLENFSWLEKSRINKVLKVSAEIIDDFIKLDFERVMSKYNGKENED